MSKSPSSAFVDESSSSREFHPASSAVASKQVVLLGAGFSTRNLGVWALASGAVSSVLHSFPGAQVRLLDYAREPATCTVKHASGTAAVELVNLRFSKRIFLPNNIARLLLTALFLRVMPSKAIKARIINANPCLKAIARADIVGSIAGGDSFSDIYGLGRLLYVSLPQILVLLLGKPLVLLPQTLGPFASAPARVIARYILRRARRVYARDTESLGEIEPLVRQDSSCFRVAQDMAFALEAIPPSGERLAALGQLDRCRPLVGLNVSGLLHMGGYNRRNMFGLKTDYRDLVRSLIQYFVRQDAHVLLVPHVFGTGPGSESDATACEAIHREMAAECGGRLHLLQGVYDHQEIKHVIGQCDFFLGSRMHACIAALSQSVPAIGLAYSRKFMGVFGTINSADLAVDLCALETEAVLGRVEDAYRRRDEIRERLQAKMPAVKSAVLSLFADVMAEDASGARHPACRKP